jgi:hypothetical protein
MNMEQPPAGRADPSHCDCRLARVQRC